MRRPKNAIKFNGLDAKVRAGELVFGYMDWGTVTKTKPTTQQKGAYQKLQPILTRNERPLLAYPANGIRRPEPPFPWG